MYGVEITLKFISLVDLAGHKWWCYYQCSAFDGKV